MCRPPDFLIIGAMKCATTTLHKQLASLPGLYMSRPKELYFFSHDGIYRKGMTWYLSFFEAAASTAFRGESSTSYTKLPTYSHTVERIQKNLPEIKLVYSMRHPIDRLISQYKHEITQRIIPKSMDINQAIVQYPQLIQYSLYAMQIEPYLEAFGQEKILPLFSERLRIHPQEEIERICRFIGYEGKPNWNPEVEYLNVSEKRRMEIPALNFFAQSPYFQPIRRYLIPGKMRDWLRGFITADIKKPVIAPKEMNRLRKCFDDDLNLLGSWLGVDLNCANFKAVVRENPLKWTQAAGIQS